MENARIVGLGFVFAIIGFFFGRTYLPATSDRALALSGFSSRFAPAATPVPLAPVIPPIIFAPVADSNVDSNAFPTPYPTPPILNDNPAPVRVAPPPAPATAPVPAPARSRPSLYPTPYPTPGNQPIISTATPATTVNHAPAPAPFSFDSFDRQSHVIYLLLALLAIGLVYKKRENEPAVCVAMFIIGFILGHYVDPGPINFSNQFNRV